MYFYFGPVCRYVGSFETTDHNCALNYWSDDCVFDKTLDNGYWHVYDDAVSV